MLNAATPTNKLSSPKKLLLKKKQVIAHTDRGWVSCYARLRSILSSLFCTLPRGLRRTRNRSKVDSRSENEAPETLLGLQMNRSAFEFDLAPQKLDLASSTS
ncbi:autophagy-related protein 3 [Iris pallida]|uniref:Autophagy-related protein 3 n=1 Tax=Iris pallida TaxID=29817 RepID=A0AAX6HCI0_IRIPA|nr:autophagy-related protein 3 [Iris pallida]KAJ6838378.1 autophagy-related protein 3 [Iris pallida]